MDVGILVPPGEGASHRLLKLEARVYERSAEGDHPRAGQEMRGCTD